MQSTTKSEPTPSHWRHVRLEPKANGHYALVFFYTRIPVSSSDFAVFGMKARHQSSYATAAEAIALGERIEKHLSQQQTKEKVRDGAKSADSSRQL